MNDPSHSLHSFQEELLRGKILLQHGIIYPDLYVYGDQAEGKLRLTYVKLENSTVTAFVSFVQCTPIEGIPCFQIGYAVPEAYRHKGLAKEIVSMALSEIQNGFKRFGDFYVEAIVGADNKFSQRVAEHAISATSVTMIDEMSGLPALQYLRKME